MDSFAEFTHLVKELNQKEGVIRNHVHEISNIEGKNEVKRLQLESTHYQYLFFFIVCILLFLYMFRMKTTDTSQIDTIMFLIVFIYLGFYLFSYYF